jgi:choline dehydrogenase-like flavoprotein
MSASVSPAPPVAAPWTVPVTPKVRKLRWALIFFVATFVVEAAMYAIEVFAGSAAARGYAVNSVAKDVLFAALGVIAIANLRRHLQLVGFIVFGHAVIVLTLFAAWSSGTTETDFPLPRWFADATGIDLPADARLAIWLAFATAVTASMAWFYVRARREAAGLESLSVFEAETIAALAEVTLESPAMTPAEIAKEVDRRWAAFPADHKHKNRLRSAFWIVALLPLLWARAPLPWLDPVRRRAVVEQRLLPALAHRSELGRLRSLLQASVRFATQMIYMGYYGDTRSHDETHYRRVGERPRTAAAIAELKQAGAQSGRRKLRTLDPDGVGDEELGAEVVIIGSGAAGSVLASEFVNRGCDVLLLDRGPYVPRDEVSDDEAGMYARLYSDGALQLSTDFTFQVLQGMCVGGGTVVNNGICFDLPDRVLAEWNGPQCKAGLGSDLERSFPAVRDMVGVGSQQPAHFSTGVRTLVGMAGQDDTANEPWKVVEANISEDCIGCGNCNIGCPYGLKLSMIEEVLPDAQAPARNGGPKGRLRILPLCRADRIELRGGRATRVSCVLRTAKPRAISVAVGKTVVVAAGAVHSSRLLMASGLGGERVGRNLSANMASFMTGVFEEPQDAFDGLQLTHYIWSGDPDDHVLETFFNPVMSQALVMPGWLGEHQRNMRRYDHLMCVGALVRSHPDPANRVRKRPHPLTGAEFDFRPSDADVKRLVRGLEAAGGRLFDGGAREVMPATFAYEVFESRGELSGLPQLIKDASDLGARTAHPQGGNAISESSDLGVVDPSFKVFGTDNVHVCDASVFPTAITVNPQLTVMALAHLAGSERIAVK